MLGVSRSGYYAFRSPKRASGRRSHDAELRGQILDIHRRSRRTYGVRRIRAELHGRGYLVGLCRVRKLMSLDGLRARGKRRFRATTDSRHDHPVAPNLLARNFTVDAPNKAWVGDITYVPTDQGWLYLATLVDLYSRRVVGWAMSENIDRHLVLDALRDAITKRRPSKGLIHHTDRGAQYACKDYQDAMKNYGAVCSMSRKGDCWDNAVAESLFARLKCELTHWERYPSRQHAMTSISEYLEEFFNRTRRHSTLGYLSPVEFELAFQTASMAA